MWGIFILSLWSFVLAVIAFAKMALLTQAVAYTNNITQLWIIFILNALLGLGFSFSTYGLWTRQNWGRLLFLGVMTLWSGANLLVLFDPTGLAQSTTFEIVTNGLRFTAGLILPLWYLNLPRIKMLFVAL